MHRLHVPACARRAAERWLRKWFPHVSLSEAVQLLRNQHAQKPSQPLHTNTNEDEREHE